MHISFIFLCFSFFLQPLAYVAIPISKYETGNIYSVMKSNYTLNGLQENATVSLKKRGPLLGMLTSMFPLGTLLSLRRLLKGFGSLPSLLTGGGLLGSGMMWVMNFFTKQLSDLMTGNGPVGSMVSDMSGPMTEMGANIMDGFWKSLTTILQQGVAMFSNSLTTDNSAREFPPFKGFDFNTAETDNKQPRFDTTTKNDNTVLSSFDSTLNTGLSSLMSKLKGTEGSMISSSNSDNSANAIASNDLSLQNNDPKAPKSLFNLEKNPFPNVDLGKIVSTLFSKPSEEPSPMGSTTTPLPNINLGELVSTFFTNPPKTDTSDSNPNLTSQIQEVKN